MTTTQPLLPAGEAIKALPIAPAAPIRRFLRLLLAGAFVLALFTPLAGMWRGWDTKSTESRLLTASPGSPRNSDQLKKYTARCLDSFRDHFGFRNAMIHGVALMNYYGGFVTDTKGEVAVGKSGWLFYRPEGDRDLLGFRGLKPLTEAELDAWQHLFEQREARLAVRHIPYIIFFAPDKQTIYPEYLPDEYAPLTGGVSRLDQIRDRLGRAHSPVHFVDVRPALLAGKSSQRVYHMSDTHWNDVGAFVAYRQIISAVAVALPGWKIEPQPITNFNLTEIPHTGDLGRMLDLPGEYQEQWISLHRHPEIAFPPELDHLDGEGYWHVDDEKLPRLVIFHDSFVVPMFPMLVPHFSSACFRWNDDMDFDLIEKQKPDVVISELVERRLYLSPPVDLMK